MPSLKMKESFSKQTIHFSAPKPPVVAATVAAAPQLPHGRCLCNFQEANFRWAAIRDESRGVPIETYFFCGISAIRRTCQGLHGDY